MNIPTDKELITKIINGDINDFSILVSKYHKQIYTFVYHSTGNTEEASDLTQEIFIKIWKNLKKYNDDFSFKTWLFRIAKNTCIDFLRKRKEIPFSNFDDDNTDTEFSDTLIDEEPLPNELYENKEISEKIEEALKCLNIKQKTIVILHGIQDLTFEEISTILDAPMNTVKSDYRRALLKMRRYLENAPK